MPLWMAILDLVLAIAVVSAWYFWFIHVNRNRAVRIVQWICDACAGHGRVARVCWVSASRFLVHIHFSSHRFHEARVCVRLLPREMPLNWLISRWRCQQETLTFEADLDCPPAFNLEVNNCRWQRKLPRRSTPDPDRLMLVRSGPIVLTTRGDWQRDLTNMMDGFLASRDCDFQTVSFQRHSPHFSATVPLHSLDAHDRCSTRLFEALDELATEASTATF